MIACLRAELVSDKPEPFIAPKVGSAGALLSSAGCFFLPRLVDAKPSACVFVFRFTFMLQ